MTVTIQRVNYPIIIYTIIIDLFMVSIFNSLMGIPTIPLSVRTWFSYIMLGFAALEFFRNLYESRGKVFAISIVAICYFAYSIIGCLIKGIDPQIIL